MNGPLCFVLMPFGAQAGSSGAPIDFDAVYHDLIAPALAAAGLEPLRAGDELAGGILSRQTRERLMLCEFALADLTIAPPNVFFELGLRQAMRPGRTMLVFAKGGKPLPFDTDSLSCNAMPYRLGPDGKPSHADADRIALVQRLQAVKLKPAKSPVVQLVESFPDIQRLKTDVFRDRVAYSPRVKEALAAARRQGVEAVRAVETELSPVAESEAGAVIDLYLSYRAVKAWTSMIDLVPKMSPPLAATVLVREQLALALNRAGRGEEAERLLQEIIADRGPSSETCSLLGRVYKDRWEAALKIGASRAVRGHLDQAIGAYLKGFESDWRDAFPGINAVTLMELKEPPDPRREKLLPVVAYAVERRIAAGPPDYWDHATRIELAVLARNREGAEAALTDALTMVRERWEPESTARNLRLILEAWEIRREETAWLRRVVDTLQGKAGG